MGRNGLADMLNNILDNSLEAKWRIIRSKTLVKDQWIHCKLIIAQRRQG
jgi:hypothetical protein